MSKYEVTPSGVAEEGSFSRCRGCRRKRRRGLGRQRTSVSENEGNDTEIIDGPPTKVMNFLVSYFPNEQYNIKNEKLWIMR